MTLMERRSIPVASTERLRKFFLTMPFRLRTNDRDVVVERACPEPMLINVFMSMVGDDGLPPFPDHFIDKWVLLARKMNPDLASRERGLAYRALNGWTGANREHYVRAGLAEALGEKGRILYSSDIDVLGKIDLVLCDGRSYLGLRVCLKTEKSEQYQLDKDNRFGMTNQLPDPDSPYKCARTGILVAKLKVGSPWECPKTCVSTPTLDRTPKTSIFIPNQEVLGEIASKFLQASAQGVLSPPFDSVLKQFFDKASVVAVMR